MPNLKRGLATVAQLSEFDEIVDARSPSEFADDHIPGARSCPVLDDAQRARVGTLYKQASPFAARRLGAALVARNIGDHIERHFNDRDARWRPLVYCWRGGKRSGAFTHVLREIGWDARQLDGGYKAYRRMVVEALRVLPGRFSYRVVCGATGSAKSRLLTEIAAQGGQVLDLEAMAEHKGSVLGNLPDTPQPSQRLFETRLHTALHDLDPARPVFVEAESRRIGSIQVPGELIAAMRAGTCLRIEADLEERVRFLLADYRYFIADPQALKARLNCLRALHSNERIDAWLQWVDAGAWPELVRDLLVQHYDPLYRRSEDRNYVRYGEGPQFVAADLSPRALSNLAQGILAV
ncbi:MAG: tRNA 2-selenouridine(34) synthase MnmH [Betaproteobacteria bacterium]|nr:tRNA 2-selenouridine(34) synthase MnmH [Betaproteobacteria bacterium]